MEKYIYIFYYYILKNKKNKIKFVSRIIPEATNSRSSIQQIKMNELFQHHKNVYMKI